MVEACGWAEHRWDGVSGVAQLLHTFSLPLRLTAGGAASRSRLIGADRLNFIYFFIYALRGRDAQHEHSFTLLAQLHRFWAAQQNHRPAAVCLVTSTNGTKRPWNQHWTQSCWLWHRTPLSPRRGSKSHKVINSVSVQPSQQNCVTEQEE